MRQGLDLFCEAGCCLLHEAKELLRLLHLRTKDFERLFIDLHSVLLVVAFDLWEYGVTGCCTELVLHGSDCMGHVGRAGEARLLCGTHSATCTLAAKGAGKACS